MLMNLSRRVIHSHQADQRLYISNLAKEFKHEIRQELRLKSPAIEIETKATQSSLESHITTLQSQVSQLALVIPQPSLRIGLEQGVPRALQEIPEQMVSRTNDYSNETKMTNVRRPKDNSSSQRKKIWWSRSDRVVRNLFGTFHISSEIYQVSGSFDNDSEDFGESDFVRKTSVCIHPASWLIRLGINFGTKFESQINTHDWKYRLDSFRAVPDDSDIFRACRRGDIEGVKELLSLGKASVWDTNSVGWTPLHVSISLLYLCCANQ